MRKVFVTATVGGIFAGSALPLDAPTALFAASVCMALAVALAASRLDLGPETSEGRGAPSVHVRRQIILRVRPAAGLIVLAFVAHLASANAAPLGPGLTGGAYLAALALLWLSAIAHDDTSHISLIRCLVLISAVVCAMRLSGGFGAEAVAFVETALGIIVWTGIIVVALDLATYAEVPFSTIMGGVYLLLTGPAALIYLMSLAAPSLPTMLSSSLADAAIICLLVFCGLYLLNEQSLDDLFWGAHDDKTPASGEAFSGNGRGGGLPRLQRPRHFAFSLGSALRAGGRRRHRPDGRRGAADGSGARGARPARRGTKRPVHRRVPLHRAQHGEDPRGPHLREARRAHPPGAHLPRSQREGPRGRRALTALLPLPRQNPCSSPCIHPLV